MKSVFVTFLLFALSIPSFATNVSGGIYANTTWTLSNSPYIVTGDIVVFDGAALTIEPGVEVLIDGSYKLEVRGKIVAAGTAADSIVFRANTSGAGRNFWKGIYFAGTFQGITNQALFDYCVISNASHCFEMNNATQGPYIIKNSTFSNNAYVIEDCGLGGTTFRNCKFLNNHMGTYWFYEGSLYDCEFDGNDYGVESSDSLVGCKFTNTTNIAAQPYGYTSNCEFYNNNIAVKCYFNSGNNTFINNRLHDNMVGIEILTYFNGEITFTNNEFCNNVQYNVKMINFHNADLANNCWCSTDSAVIRSKIYDGYVDISKGLMSFMPFNTTCNFTTGITEIGDNNADDIDLYPNPSYDGIFNIKGVSLSDCNIRIMDIVGRTINYSVEKNNADHVAIKMDNILPGTYLVSISRKDSGTTTTKKLVIP